MKVLIISRKRRDGVGGLSRFYTEFCRSFPSALIQIAPDSWLNIFITPFAKFSHIYICDATLLPFGVLLKLIFKKPLILTAHGLDITYQNPLYQAMLKKLLPKTDAVILDSFNAKSHLLNFSLKIPVKVINPGVSLKHFEAIEEILLPNLKDKIVLTTVGNLVERKGHLWFIKNLMSKLSQEFVYLIVGDGEQKESIRQEISRLNLKKRTFLLGSLTNPQLGYVLSKTDIYISPNQKIKGNFEGFGIAAAEAAALGISVVASNVDGISEAIKHEKNGILVKPTLEEFFKSLIHLKNPKLRKKLGQRAKEYTRINYNWSKTANQYFKVFESVGKI